MKSNNCREGKADYWKIWKSGKTEDYLFGRRWTADTIISEGPHLARKYMLSMTRDSNIETNRSDLIKYFNFLIEMLEELEENKSQYDEEYVKISISEIKQCFDSFKKLFRSVDHLPESFFTPSLDKPKTDAYHVFHAYLEIHWIYFNFAIKYITMRENDKAAKSIDSEINSLLSSITTISYKLFCKNGHNLLFSCNCLSNLWKVVIELIENLEKKSLCSEFWNIFNEVMSNFIENRSKINFSKYPVSFPINFLKHVSQIRDSNNQTISNYALVESALKFMDREDISEVNLRHIISDIYCLSNLWKPKADIIIMLWEYFHKKLNSAFSIPNDNNFLQSFEKFSVADIAKYLKNMISGEISEDECSFLTFLKMLGLFLNSNYRQANQCQRIKGRILPKFTATKIEALNDVGFRNFCILYLTMAVSTDLQEICPKLLQLLNQLNFNSMDYSKQCLMVKVETVIIYLYVNDDKHAGNIVDSLVTILSEYSSLRDHTSNKLMSIACLGVHDIIDVSTTLNNGEAALIGPWLSKYLSVCPYADLVTTLSMLTLLVTKTRQIRRYHTESGNESLVSNLFTHVLPTLKSLFSNDETASSVADVCLEFVKMTIENDSHMKTNDLLKMFIQSEQFNERAAHHFMINLLEQDVIINLLESDSSTLNEILFVECWVKCALLHDERCSQSPPSLMNLQYLKHVKKLLPLVDAATSNQNHLSLFFYGLGCLWKNSQSFQEKCQLKNMVNQYLAGVDKLLSNIVKTSASAKYLGEIIMSIGTLFLHCSSIIYYRAKPTCLLHSIISSLLLPPQMYMENKRSPLVTTAVCRSWFMFMCGIFQLDKDNDPYVENTLRDLVVLYTPYFVAMTGGDKYEILHRVVPDQVVHPYTQLEVFILNKLATSFVSCRGKQTHQHACKALAIIHNLASNIQKIEPIVKNTFFAIFEQCMFAESGSLSSKLAHQVLEIISSNLENSNQESIQTAIKEIMTAVCKKYFSFHSNQFFKLLSSLPVSIKKLGKEIIPYLETEVEKLERMRGVKEDAGLRAGLKNLMLS